MRPDLHPRAAGRRGHITKGQLPIRKSTFGLGNSRRSTFAPNCTLASATLAAIPANFGRSWPSLGRV